MFDLDWETDLADLNIARWSLALLATWGLAGGAPVAAQDVVFDETIITSCLAEDGLSETCIAHAATACIQMSRGGGTTLASGACYEREWLWWDARLNATYQALRDKERARDAAAPEAPSVAIGLRDMQRAWIPFRDLSCEYEALQWGGGTGAGPASTSCLLELTAVQALRLERYLTQY